jgi:hypothetical protein
MVYLFGLPDGSNLEQRWGRVVTGEVVIDGKQFHKPGDKLCTKPVSRSPGNLVHTHNGEPVTVLPQLQALVSVKELVDAVAQWHD